MIPDHPPNGGTEIVGSGVMAERHLRPVHDELDFEPDEILWHYGDGITRNKPHWTHPASDSRGHHEQINTKVPPEWLPRLHHIANDKEYNSFRSVQDVVRCFTFFGMEWYEKWRGNDPQLTELVEVLQFIERTRNAQTELELREQMLVDAAQRIETCARLGDMEALAEAISNGQELSAKAKIDTSELDKVIGKGLKDLQ